MYKKGRVRMSIITSVYLKEAIVMSADSRITGTTTHQDGTRDRHTISDNGQKLFLIKNRIGVSCCGEQEIDGRTISDFIRLFEQQEVVETDTVKSVAEKLNQYVTGKYKSYVMFHVCGYNEGIKYFYRIDGKDVSSVVDEKNPDECGAGWNGEPKVIANLLAGDHAIPIEWNFMQLKDGIDFAEFLVDITCKVHRFQTGVGTCGGPIDILLLTKDYSKWVRHKVLNP